MRVHLLLGAPGCGKGSAAKDLVEKLQLIHLSTGDILRDAVSQETEIGLRAKAIMASGNLVDDDTVNGLVFARLREETCDVLLDGYPRTLHQAQALDQFLSDQGIELGHVVEIEVPRDVLAKRVVGRRVCSNPACGAIYHVDNKPPARDGACDRCGSRLKQRSDDTLTAFESRMLAFEQTFQPMAEHYRGRPQYRSVDGNYAPAVVSGNLFPIFMEMHA